MTDLRIVTQSELTTFLRCKRKWYLGWFRALRKRMEYKTPLTVGNVVHGALQEYYGHGGDPLEYVAGQRNRLLEEFPEQADQVSGDVELAYIMVEGYLEWLQETGADADLEVYAAEEPVEVMLKEGLQLRGKLDARAKRSSDGLKLQLEHKTAGNLTDLPKTAQGNFQFLTYDLLAYMKELEEQEPARTDGVLLNMLRKVKRTKTAKPPFYGRHEVIHNTEELRAHWRHVVAIADEIGRAERRLEQGETHHAVAPPRWEQSCTWQCPFFQVCPMMDDGSDYEGFLAVEYEPHDPMLRYKEPTE